MSDRLAGRVALITGASRGIGRGIAQALAAEGAAVVLNFRRDREAAGAAVDAIRAAGGRAIALQASMSDLGAVDRLARDAATAFGPVDLLVHNAGNASRGHSVSDTEPDEVLGVMTTHALAAHRLTSLLLAGMREAPRGDVIAISSSEVREMRAGGAPYNMAKAALEAFALTLAKEERNHGIRVNIVAPGLTVTDMGSRLVRAKTGMVDMTELDRHQPFGRLCRPGDIASAVTFFASHEAALITGQRIVVDGGSNAFPVA